MSSGTGMVSARADVPLSRYILEALAGSGPRAFSFADPEVRGRGLLVWHLRIAPGIDTRRNTMFGCAQFVLLPCAAMAGEGTALLLMEPFTALCWIAAGLLVAAGVVHLAARRRRSPPPSPSVPQESPPGELSMLRAVVASLPDLIYVKDANSRFLLANQGTAELMGVRSGDDLIGKTDFDYFPPQQAEGFFRDEQQIIATGQPLVSQNEHIPETDGKTRWILTTKVPLRDGEGRAVGIIGIGRNITKLKETESALTLAREDLHFKATHDSLTSLLNREAVLEMMERELARSAREGGCLSVLMADLDHFKTINDRYGHPTGDDVLRETACRFLKAVRKYDLVGRYGGEEFLIVLSQCPGCDSVIRADQLRKAVSASPVTTARGPIPITISIGVLATRDWGYPGPEDVLREVDIALYAAKADGRNRCRVATPPTGTSLSHP